MAAQNKDQLIDITQKEFAKLSQLLDRVDGEQALVKGDEDTSIKDIAGHRAHWIDLFLGWYADGLAGRPVYFPAKGYKWNDLKRYNAELRAAQAGLGWSDAHAMLEANHRKLLSFMEEKSDGDLYGGPMKGANNNWTPGRWAEAAGPSHYRSAAKYIRARLRAYLA
ncbi:ClbS/DfsB family four-helix bundle protein [Hoeflea poritis]|uniref:ClbS/DfsB family four-helix bundle protein n=1 Tax=Hoeflea poritis TaxID=2993659 RepID=A0ABT4VPF9_9HYPH|nr:ClbS/DfsB family four-helix bundle protein [Hoeflea poritis]MDA4846566.1 ClbS/DfsB family four-helix bundle protein [Hoeflea poritis]